MEQQKPHENIDWDSDKLHKNVWKEMRELYDWWINIRINRQSPLEDENLKIPPLEVKDVCIKARHLSELVRPDKKKYAKFYVAMRKDFALEKMAERRYR